MNDALKYVLIIVFSIAIIVLVPVLFIWSLNTLFPVLMIPYTIETWIAMFIVSGAFGSMVKAGINSSGK